MFREKWLYGLDMVGDKIRNFTTSVKEFYQRFRMKLLLSGKKVKLFTGVFVVLVIAAAVPVGVALVGRVQDIRERAQVAPVSPEGFDSHEVGSLDGRNFYRTLFTTEGQGAIYSAKTNRPFGIYDASSNKTFITFQGDKNRRPAPPSWEQDFLSNLDPYIIAYNHTTHKFEGPVKIAGIFLPEIFPDAHFYSVPLVDKLGYVHVFTSFHNSGRNISHAVSKSPGDITQGWRMLEIPNTFYNTYISAFLDNRGEIYLTYRGAGFEKSFPDSMIPSNIWWDNCMSLLVDGTLKGDPVVINEKCKFYEPEMWVKSTDNGNTWTYPKHLVDPGAPSNVPGVDYYVYDTTSNDEGFRTIYVEDMALDKEKNGVHFNFGIAQNHMINSYEGIDKGNFYAFFDFDDDSIYNAMGEKVGLTLTRAQYDVEPQKYQYTKLVAGDTRNISGFTQLTGGAVIPREGSGGKLVIYHSKWDSELPLGDPNYYSQGRGYPFKSVWDGTKWEIMELKNELPANVDFKDGEYREGTGTDLFVNMDTVQFSMECLNGKQIPVRLYNYKEGSAWKYLDIYADNMDWQNRNSHYTSFVVNSRPEIRAILLTPKFDCHYKPDLGLGGIYPIGAYYIWGEQNPTVAAAPIQACSQVRCTEGTSVVPQGCSPKKSSSSRCYVDWRGRYRCTGTETSSLACTVSSDKAWLEVSGGRARKMRFINVSTSENCSQIGSGDSRWSQWEDYSQNKYWRLSASDGKGKVCVQFQNGCEQESSACGYDYNISSGVPISTPAATGGATLPRGDRFDRFGE